MTTTTNPITRRFTINAVISTGYKERYSDLFEKLELSQKFPSQANKYITEITQSKNALKFANEVNNFLSVSYSINPNFIENSLLSPLNSSYIHYFENVEITSQDGDVLLSNDKIYQCVDGSALANNTLLNVGDDEIYLSVNTYNDLFNTNLKFEDQDFEEKTIILNLYSATRKLGDEAKLTKTLTVRGLTPTKGEYASVVSANTFSELRRADLYAHTLYFYNGENEVSLYETASSLYYENSSASLKSI